MPKPGPQPPPKTDEQKLDKLFDLTPSGKVSRNPSKVIMKIVFRSSKSSENFLREFSFLRKTKLLF